MDRLTRFLLSFGGLGLLPVAPGTWGTAGAALVAWLLPACGWPLWAGLVCATASLLTILLGKRAERLADGKDPGFIVMDEVAGYFVTLAALARPEPLRIVAAFFVFRLFDIWKPWPGRRLEKLPAGYGVLLDDLAAGLYGLAVMLLLDRIPGWSWAF